MDGAERIIVGLCRFVSAITDEIVSKFLRTTVTFDIIVTG